MRVIFLDIDGVLTSARMHVSTRASGPWKEFDPICVNLLKIFLDVGNYQLVISSTWRNHLDILDPQLDKHDLLKYLHKDWRTPETFHRYRAQEISKWLENNPEVTEYMILDDVHQFTDEQEKFTVYTDPDNGILFEHFVQMIRLSGIDFQDTIIK